MGRVEMMILVFAIAILGRYSLTVNNALANNEIHVLQSEYTLNAVTIAESMFRQAWLKSFDENAVGTIPTAIPSDFTEANSIGPETGEVYPNFDDLDDYNSLAIADTAVNGMPYELTVVVGYINAANKDSIVSTKTTLKRMDVTIVSEYLQNNITLSRIYPYWR